LQRFTKQLEVFFKTPNVCLFNNGTLALQLGLQGMRLTGEVITTPFTFVATTHTLYWNKLRPVFVDIEPDHYTLDPEKVEAAITPWTSTILAVHVFGSPCQVKKLADIAHRHNLTLIYDAAHAFGVEIDGVPIAKYGDLSMFSFHPTKLYHSIEGGALVFSDPGYKKIFDYLKNFGFASETEVVMPGTNAKMNEFQALMGILGLKRLDELIEKGREIETIYRERLTGVPGIQLPLVQSVNVHYNFAYMPIEVHEKEFGMSRDRLYEELRKYNIFTRRYFYPLLTDFACYKYVQTNDPLTIAKGVAARILCLPTYYTIDANSVDRICELIIKIGKQ